MRPLSQRPLSPRSKSRGALLSWLTHWYTISPRDRWRIVTALHGQHIYHWSVTGGNVAAR